MTTNDAAERLRLTITSQQARLGERITAGMLNALAEALAAERLAGYDDGFQVGKLAYQADDEEER